MENDIIGEESRDEFGSSVAISKDGSFIITGVHIMGPILVKQAMQGSSSMPQARRVGFKLGTALIVQMLFSYWFFR